jgi:hypothetical protein
LELEPMQRNSWNVTCSCELAAGTRRLAKRAAPMNLITTVLIKLGILKKDLDYHFVRALMVIVYLFFGYQKWFQYEAQGLIHYISHDPLTFWMYPVFAPEVRLGF